LAAAAFTFIALPFGMAGFADEKPDCNPNLLDTVCKCNLADLRPLQGAVGRIEVEHKKQQILNNEDCERNKLKKDPIKVIFGPDNRLYIIDHHHGALAWLKARTERGESTTGFCRVQAVADDEGKRVAFGNEHNFWETLKSEHLVHLKNEMGEPISASDLPQTLNKLYEHDDPYRSLAWRVRDKGFCRPAYSQDFLEFHWADFLRRRIPAKDVQKMSSNVDQDQKELIERAIDFAHSPDAKDLIGYSLDKCPKGEEKKC
jgi:hypothetical protein